MKQKLKNYDIKAFLPMLKPGARGVKIHLTSRHLSFVGWKSYKNKVVDLRVPRMLQGYLEDLYATLVSLRRLVQPKGLLAFIVGYLRHLGELIEVDYLLGQLAQQADLKWLTTWVVHYRGNSAQQMGRYGRQAAEKAWLF